MTQALLLALLLTQVNRPIKVQQNGTPVGQFLTIDCRGQLGCTADKDTVRFTVDAGSVTIDGGAPFDYVSFDAGTMNANNANIGQLDAGVAGSFTNFSTTFTASVSQPSAVCVGANCGAAFHEPFTGLLDEVEFFDRAISLQEVQMDYNRGAARGYTAGYLYAWQNLATGDVGSPTICHLP